MSTCINYGVLDEDSMASDSATDIATQQSIKAYSDSLVVDAGYTLLSTTTISGSPTELLFTGLTDAYKIYAMEFANISANTTAIEFLAQVSIDNGSSFISSAASYSWANFKYGGTDSSSAGDTNVNLYSGGINGQTTSGMTVRMLIVNPTDSSVETQFIFTGVIRLDNSPQNMRQSFGVGKRLNAEDNDAIRVFVSSSAMTDGGGAIYLYGVS